MAAGIGRAEGDLGQLAKMAHRPDAAQRWRRAKVLVIDEVCDFPYFPLPLPLLPPPPTHPTPHCAERSMTIPSHLIITTEYSSYCWCLPGLHSLYALPCVFVVHIQANSCKCRYITIVALKLLRGHASKHCIFSKACRAIFVVVMVVLHTTKGP